MSGIKPLLYRVFAVCLLVNAAGAEAAFDLPLAKAVVRAHVPPSPGLPVSPGDVTITCYYYPDFMVKVIARPQVGMSEVGIVMRAKPSCVVRNLDEVSAYWGPFKGVKSGFLFFDTGSPGERNEQGVVILDRTGRMLVMDNKIGPFESIRTNAGALVLQYRRVLHHSCSLYYGGATGCWGEIKALTGLTDASTPACRDAYEALARKYKEHHWHVLGPVWDHPAVIAYNVEARIEGRTVRQTARSGPAECWPAF